MGVLDCEDKRHAAGCSKHYVGHGHSAHRCGSHDFRPPDGRSVRHDTPISIELGCLSKLRVRVTHTGKPIAYFGFRGACCRPFWGHCRSLRKPRQGEAPCAGLRSAAQACVEKVRTGFCHLASGKHSLRETSRTPARCCPVLHVAEILKSSRNENLAVAKLRGSTGFRLSALRMACNSVRHAPLITGLIAYIRSVGAEKPHSLTCDCYGKK